jgi:hypothetical protein
MARPVKRVVDYFSHDCNHGQITDIIDRKYGNDGYAIFYKIPEILGTADGHYYDARGSLAWEHLLTYFHVDEGKAVQVLDTLASLNYVDPVLWSIRVLWSDDFIVRIAEVYKRRVGVELPKKPDISVFKKASVDNKPVSTNTNGVSVDNNPPSSDSNRQSKLKESKLKEIGSLATSDENLDLVKGNGVVKTFEECGGKISTAIIAQELTDAEREYGNRLVCAGFRWAGLNGKRGYRLLAYCRPIWEDWKANGIPGNVQRRLGISSSGDVIAAGNGEGNIASSGTDNMGGLTEYEA